VLYLHEISLLNTNHLKRGGFDDKSMPGDNFNTNLNLLEEHCDPENKELCNLLQCMLLEDTDLSQRKSCAQHFYHSEQRILIHVRCSIKKELGRMSKEGELKDLYALALHIYSTNDPCYKALWTQTAGISGEFNVKYNYVVLLFSLICI
jgi:hypothetical protein